MWSSFRQLKFDYKLLDLFVTNEYKFITPGETNFVYVSDAYNHVPYIHIASVKFRVSRENNLIATLQNIDENIILHIPTRIGHFYKLNLSNRELMTYGKVSDFNMWDINEFVTPPWQKNNWKSYCPLTGAVRILQ